MFLFSFCFFCPFSFLVGHVGKVFGLYKVDCRIGCAPCYGDNNPCGGYKTWRIADVALDCKRIFIEIIYPICSKQFEIYLDR